MRLLQRRENPGLKRPSVPTAALSGVLAAALTIGVAELLAALLVRASYAGGTPSPVLAVGGAVVDRTPRWLKDAAVSAFGTGDKVALITGIALVLLIVSAAIGVLAFAHQRLGLLAVVVLGGVGAAAVLTRPHARGLDALPVLAGTLAGLWMLAALVRSGQQASRTDAAIDRRDFFRLAGTSAALAIAGVGLAQLLQRASRAAAASRAAVRLPAATPLPASVSTAGIDVQGITPFLIPPVDFYRIDTALAVPQLTTQDWRLRIHGMVKNPIELTYDDLLALPMVDTLLTLSCVSNEVGGDLVGNQMWRGHPMRDLLARAVPSAGADMVLSTSVDGWAAGTPLGALTDPGRDALLAIAMGGVPLPLEHGFPVRMVVPGLYGYVSATKWVVDLEVTRFDLAQGYWTPRGWSARGPIKTESRIDVPRGGQVRRLANGTIAVAGVAWAPHTGIAKVEVRVDEGEWREARLGDAGDADTWRQWVYAWPATPGDHTLQVRATDASGYTQTAAQAPPPPNGATGWDAVTVTVEG